MNGTIYCIRHADSGKMYIGQTKNDPKRRFYYHEYQAYNTDKHHPLYNAIRHYGVVGNFEFGIMHRNISSIEELDRLERYYIAKHNTVVPGGYNISTGGGASDYRASQISKYTLERTISPETIEKMKKNHRVFNYRGKMYSMKDFIAMKIAHPSIKYTTLINRIRYLHWDIEKAISKPASKGNGSRARKPYSTEKKAKISAKISASLKEHYNKKYLENMCKTTLGG